MRFRIISEVHPELLHMRPKALAKSLLSVQKMGCAMNWRSRIQIRNFILQETEPVCPDMKLITLEKILHVLQTGENEVTHHRRSA